MYYDLEKKHSIDIVTAMEDDLKAKHIKLTELRKDIKVQKEIVKNKDK